jgi:glycerol uptake facilitator-like aquaporin
VNAPLGRRVATEAIGTALLVAVVVGSRIQATELSHDVSVQLLANSLATVFGLGVLILLLGPISGAHFNPAVTLAAWFTGRRDPDSLALRDVAAYIPAQIAGAIGGAILADAMFAKPLVKFSAQDRSAGRLLLGEAVATAARRRCLLPEQGQATAQVALANGQSGQRSALQDRGGEPVQDRRTSDATRWGRITVVAHAGVQALCTWHGRPP